MLNNPNILDIKEAELIDLAVDHNLAPTNYFSGWYEIAKWQIDMLISEGMKEDSYVLDIGCGAMRMGLSLVNFLVDGRYCGIDAFEGYTSLARTLATKYCEGKTFDLVCNDNLDFEQFEQKFDFAISQSVFTHLSNTNIEKSFDSLKKVMKPGGKLIFTYLINTTATRGFLYSGIQAMERPIIDGHEYFEKIARERSINYHLVNGNHPTNQSVAICVF